MCVRVCVCLWCGVVCMFSYQLTRTKAMAVVVVDTDDDCCRRLECRHKDPLSKR